MEQKKAKKLLEKYRRGQLSADELKLLEAWFISLNLHQDEISETDLLTATAKMRENVTHRTGTARVVTNHTVPGSSIFNTGFYRIIKWSAAAIFILSAGWASYLLLQSKPETSNAEVKNQNQLLIKNDIQPAISGAFLTLEDGSIIELGTGSDSLFAAGNTKINKKGDRIEYSRGKGISGEVVYHTLETPRGTFFKTILSDGTAVWLNAASRLKYPATFEGNTRQVFLTGEAYFEVAHNSKKPFIVDANGTLVNVLGTHFNVKSYPEDQKTITTLVEGSVEVKVGKKMHQLEPGTQSSADFAGNYLIKKTGVNMDVVLAWKNGLFNFNDADISMVMQQLGHWYDIDVFYPRGKPDIRFFGEMDRGFGAEIRH
nr:FecR domain-containing protein [Chitinophagaceae bacterium]